MNLSLYFDTVWRFLSLHRGTPIPIGTLNGLLAKRGLSVDDIDAVINGVIAELIQSNITPKDMNISVEDFDGNITQQEPYNPTKTELIKAITGNFTGLNPLRVDKLIDYMISKKALEENQDGHFFRNRPFPHNIAIKL